MKNLFSIIAILSIALLLNSCHSQTHPREDFVRSYFLKYPEAALQDIYKGSFQDVFGPAHLLTNREAVENYINREMETAKSLEGEDYVPCGWQGNFYQVNLKVIADGRIPMDDFVDAFIASANGIDTTLTQAWLEEWEQLQQATRKIVPHLQGFKEDSTLLANLLKQGKYVVHHSRKFNQYYHPHYRIIRRDLFEKKIFPKLNRH